MNITTQLDIERLWATISILFAFFNLNRGNVICSQKKKKKNYVNFPRKRTALIKVPLSTICDLSAAKKERDDMIVSQNKFRGNFPFIAIVKEFSFALCRILSTVSQIPDFNFLEDTGLHQV